jgi:hypothetical protein
VQPPCFAWSVDYSSLSISYGYLELYSLVAGRATLSAANISTLASHLPKELDIRPDAAQVRVLNLLQLSVHVQTARDVNSLAGHIISIFGHKKLNNIRYIFTSAVTA